MMHRLDRRLTNHTVTLHQDGSGVPDRNERGDHFGASVGFTPGACVGPFNPPGLMIGAPGEDVAGQRDAGR